MRRNISVLTDRQQREKESSGGSPTKLGVIRKRILLRRTGLQLHLQLPQFLGKRAIKNAEERYFLKVDQNV